jgi:hypothetical protein
VTLLERDETALTDFRERSLEAGSKLQRRAVGGGWWVTQVRSD